MTRLSSPPGVHLPDGTEVTIEPREKARAEEAVSFFDSIRDLVGSIKDAPADLAAGHDHYAHGAPKGVDCL
jgi:hypothetical protein